MRARPTIGTALYPGGLSVARFLDVTRRAPLMPKGLEPLARARSVPQRRELYLLRLRAEHLPSIQTATSLAALRQYAERWWRFANLNPANSGSEVENLQLNASGRLQINAPCHIRRAFSICRSSFRLLDWFFQLRRPGHEIHLRGFGGGSGGGCGARLRQGQVVLFGAARSPAGSGHGLVTRRSGCEEYWPAPCRFHVRNTYIRAGHRVLF